MEHTLSSASLYDSHIAARGGGNGFAILVTLLLSAGVLYAGMQPYNDLSSMPVTPRSAMVDGQEPGARVGPDAAGRDHATG